jgi:hypothetical protein
MKTTCENNMLSSALAFVSIAMTRHAVACDFTPHDLGAERYHSGVFGREV